jgi:hypothetical protein
MKHLRHLFVTLAILATAAPSTWGALLLQAEDYLLCPGVEPTFDRRASLTQIIEERRTFASGISAEQSPLTLTFFGIRIDEPGEVMKWRENEDKRIRGLIFPSDMEKVKTFAEKVRGQISNIHNSFPLGLAGNLSISQIVTESEDGKGDSDWKMEVVVPVHHPGYTMQCQWERGEEDTLLVRITLVRPSVYQLIDREPETTGLKAVMAPKGKPSNKVEVWMRAIDADMPLKVEYRKLDDSGRAGS